MLRKVVLVNLSIAISSNHTKNLLFSVSITQSNFSSDLDPFSPTLESSSNILNLPSFTLITVVISLHLAIGLRFIRINKLLFVSISSSVDAESSEVLYVVAATGDINFNLLPFIVLVALFLYWIHTFV